MASIRLTVETLVILRVGHVGMLGPTSMSLVTSLARMTSIGGASGPVGSLVRSSLLLALTRYLTFGPSNWCWARDVFRRIVSIEFLVNGLWNGCNLGTKLLLDSVEIEAIIPIDQVDRHTQMSETSRSTNTMEVSLRVLRKVEIDNHVHSLDVDTTSEKIRTHEVAANTIPKVMEHTVTVMLQHLSVRVKAGISKLGNFLRKQLHSVSGVAENNGLVDLKF